MTTVSFIISTLLAGFVFGLALLWVLAEWLKADDEAEVREKDVQASLDKLEAAGCSEPQAGCCAEYDNMVRS